MAGTGNSDHVTWRELNLALDPIKQDVREIKAAVEDMRRQAWLGPKGRDLVAGAGILGAGVAILLAVLH
jgi:tetrahydromethanopterin S-methyltransferase subunit F